MSLQCPHARVQVSIAETDVEDLANNGGTAAQIEAAIRRPDRGTFACPAEAPVPPLGLTIPPSVLQRADQVIE
jgi:hypothetical protein